MASERSKMTGPGLSGQSTGLSIWPRRNGPQKPPPPPTYNVRLLLLMPMPGHGFTSLDLLNLDFEAAFRQIREQFQVAITVLDDGDMIEIKAFNRKKANEAVRALRKILERKPGDKTVWRPLALIKPCGSDNARIALITEEGIEGARPVAVVNSPGHNASSTDESDAAQYKEELQNAVARAIENLRYVPNRMRMRINFGHVLLKEWKKDRSEYTFSELKQIAQRAGPRGTVYMHTYIGHDNTVSRIKEQLPLIIKDCAPRDVRIESTEDIQPSMSLVLLTKNLVTESVIDVLRGKSAIGSNDRVTYKYALGTMTVFHRERRARAVTIMTSCPEESFDWCLEVENEVDHTTPPPFNDKTLRESVMFQGPVITNGFPSFNIKPIFLQNNGVDLVIAKTTWSYLINSQYVLEVGLYQQWTTFRTKPRTGAVVSLYGCDWDYMTTSADISTGPREWTNFADNFLTSGTYSDTFDGLISLVSQIQAVLTEATKGDS